MRKIIIFLQFKATIKTQKGPVRTNVEVLLKNGKNLMLL